MLSITYDAIEAIKSAVGTAEGGLRISTVPHSLNGRGPELVVEVVPAPVEDDAVVDAEGAQVFVEPAAADAIEGKVLDAERDGDALRFSIVDGD